MNNAYSRGSGGGGTFQVVLVTLIILVFVTVIGFFGYKFIQYSSTETPSNQEDVKGDWSIDGVSSDDMKLLKKIDQILDIPRDTVPVIATIKDVQTLREEQKFYEGAKNGDKLLIYPESGKAIIYSEEREKIVNVGPVYVGGGESNSNSVDVENNGGDE